MSTTAALSGLRGLSYEPTYYGDCCHAISWGLLEKLAERLPQSPALTLSIGCGSGRLEGLLLLATEEDVNVVGVEVPPCVNHHLPQERLLRVPCTASLHPDALLASTLMFVYPRKSELIDRYLEAFMMGAVEQVIWLGPKCDWPDVEVILRDAFLRVELLESGLPSHELLAIATPPRTR